MRFVFLTKLVPIPPLFLVCPLRVMRPPLCGRFPVIAQIFDIRSKQQRFSFAFVNGLFVALICDRIGLEILIQGKLDAGVLSAVLYLLSCLTQ